MRSLKYFGVALTAGLVGAGVALLLAPASGEETRRRLARSIDDEKRRMMKKIDREKANLIKRGRRAMDDVSEFVTDELEAAQKKIAKVVPLRFLRAAARGVVNSKSCPPSSSIPRSCCRRRLNAEHRAQRKVEDRDRPAEEGGPRGRPARSQGRRPRRGGQARPPGGGAGQGRQAGGAAPTGARGQGRPGPGEAGARPAAAKPGAPAAANRRTRARPRGAGRPVPTPRSAGARPGSGKKQRKSSLAQRIPGFQPGDLLVPGGAQGPDEVQYFLRGTVAAEHASIEAGVGELMIKKGTPEGEGETERAELARYAGGLAERFESGAIEPLLPSRPPARRNFAGVVERAKHRRREIGAFLRGLDLGRTETSHMDSHGEASLQSLMEWAARLENLAEADEPDQADYAMFHRGLDQLENTTEALIIDVELTLRRLRDRVRSSDAAPTLTQRRRERRGRRATDLRLCALRPRLCVIHLARLMTHE